MTNTAYNNAEKDTSPIKQVETNTRNKHETQTTHTNRKVNTTNEATNNTRNKHKQQTKQQTVQKQNKTQ